jgi:hypothetical protein
VRNSRVWERACGLTRTVVEGVEFDDEARAVVCRYGPSRARGTDVGVAIVVHRVTTMVRVAGGGER